MEKQLTTPLGQKAYPAENNYGVLSDTKSKTQKSDNSPPTQEEIERVLQYLLSQNTPKIAQKLTESFNQVAGKKKNRRNKTSKRRRWKKIVNKYSLICKSSI